VLNRSIKGYTPGRVEEASAYCNPLIKRGFQRSTVGDRRKADRFAASVECSEKTKPNTGALRYFELCDSIAASVGPGALGGNRLGPERRKTLFGSVLASIIRPMKQLLISSQF